MHVTNHIIQKVYVHGLPKEFTLITRASNRPALCYLYTYFKLWYIYFYLYQVIDDFKLVNYGVRKNNRRLKISINFLFECSACAG